VIDVDEPELVLDFFGGKPGYFVEVGANEPRVRSQTWHLEQKGWTGVLVEPLPHLARKLRQTRRARVFENACSSPQNAGRHLPLYVAGPLSSLDRGEMAPGAMPDGVIEVPIKTLDDILADAGAQAPLDFISIDVEGHEIDVLRGFDLARWRPRLVLLEDHVGNLIKHRYISRFGYRLIRRTGNNGWYVPASADVAVNWPDRFALVRKYYLGLPFRVLRNRSRSLRQPFKDRAQLRRKARAEAALVQADI